MKCPFCSREIEDDSVFCSYCGMPASPESGKSSPEPEKVDVSQSSLNPVKTQSSLEPMINVKDQGALQPDYEKKIRKKTGKAPASSRMMRRILPFTAGIVLLCIALMRLIPGKSEINNLPDVMERAAKETAKESAGTAEEEDTVIYIPDPVLKRVIQRNC